MTVLRRTAWLWIVLPAAAACSAAAREQSGVTTVQARIDGITCPTCVPPLRAALHKRFDRARIDVDDATDTATVRFDDHQPFSAAAFRQATAAVRMRVVGFDLHACGRIDAAGSERWLTAGSNRFRLHDDGRPPTGTPLCVDGRLEGTTEPLTLDVASFELQHVS